LKFKDLTSKIILTLAILGVLSIFSVGVNADVTNVGYIDVNEAYYTHPQMEVISQEMEAEMMEMQSEMEQVMQELQQSGDHQQLQQLQQQYQQDLQEKQIEFEVRLDEAIRPDLDEIREELNLDIILVEQAVVIGARDVTEEVIEHFEQL